MNELQNKWNAIYLQNSLPATACNVLKQHLCLLPNQGKALDLACGLGGNALELAHVGLAVDALDVSDIAIQKLQQTAGEHKLKVNAQVALITPSSLPLDYYNVIVISRFLDRSLCNAIMASLTTGGLLFYQTFTANKIADAAPSNPDYLLTRNELMSLFSPLQVIFYQEYDRVGNMQVGDRNEAYFIGQKS